jgi:fermentation-respiration switch protein FrsA (DUF1100 family)
LSVRTSVLRAGVAALVGLGLGVGMLVALQGALLFPTSQIPASPPHLQSPDGLIRVDVPHADGLSEGWFLPGHGVSPEAPGPVVFYAHGNGELIDFAVPALEIYRRRGLSLALVEYRGYGRSGGSPSETGIVADQVAFYDRIVARPEVDPARVVFHGRSLGGGAILGLSAHRAARAVVLESTFRSVPQLAWEKFFAPRFVLRDVFDNERAIAQLEVPVLLFHGENDELIPFAHGQALAAAARDAALVAYPSGHNDLPPDQADYWRRIFGHLRAADVL